MPHGVLAIRHTPHMPWPLPLLARLAFTCATLAGVTTYAVGKAPLAVQQHVHPLVPLTVGVVGTAVLFALWRRATWPKRAARLHSVAEPAQPYQRDILARVLIERRGFLFARRALFTGAGRPWTALRGVPQDYNLRFLRPIPVHTSRGRTWWAVGNEFYWADASYRADTVEAVVDAMRWRRRARLDASYVDLEVPTEERRERILAGLRPNLSKHNGLVCIRCRGVIDLREEPVAPVWTDGGVKLADLQLLCSNCNAATRAKRARTQAAAREAAAKAERSTYSF